MRIIIAAALGIAAIESAALACSCLMPPDDPAELRKLAGQSMEGAVALAEIEALTTYTPGGAETVRVTRLIAGSVPAQFTIARGPMASSASCDIIYTKGDRDLVIVYTAPAATASTFRTSGLCTDGMLDKPAFRDEVARLLGGEKSTGGERG